MRIRKEFTGMLPAAIEKFEALLRAVPGARVTRGYSPKMGHDSLHAWGAACTIVAPDQAILAKEAENLGITVKEDGSCEYTGEGEKKLSIEDFKTFRVGPRLEMLEASSIKTYENLVTEEVTK